ncbi:hypothetical protein [Spongiactinospora sp. 9N601]|uniref:hypothetical protein n=1 Tax=Spongiactinospora sp. 9N601 TaxID=3375149 RepID=UPI0037AA20E3
MTAENIRRDFRLALKGAEGIEPGEWTPRELRHSLVSLLPAHDVPIGHISRLVGRINMVVTQTVYRFQLRPVMQEGATVTDRIFPLNEGRSHSYRHSSPVRDPTGGAFGVVL